MFKRLPHETQQYITALFSSALADLYETWSAIPWGIEYEREKSAVASNMKLIERHYAAIIGPDNQELISEEEALLYLDLDDPLIDREECLLCSRQANAWYGKPQTKNYGRTFTGRFIDIREIFTSYLDQTANEKLAEGAQADRDHYDAYGPND